MDYNKIYINSSNIIDNLESMYYKTDNIKLKIKYYMKLIKIKKTNFVSSSLKRFKIFNYSINTIFLITIFIFFNHFI